MPTPFQLKTFPEILAAMFATARSQLDPDIDLNIGSILRAIYEACSLQDAEQYVQIGKLLDLFSRGNAIGDDLDRRGLDFGADVFTDMRRRQANTSISAIVVGDGTIQRSATLVADVPATSSSFSISDPTNWPAAGSMMMEPGTLRQEEVFFTLSGAVVTIVSPATGTVNPHLQGGTVKTIATRSVLAVQLNAGGTSASIQSGTEGAWPSSGSVIFERDTVRRELRTFTRVGTTLTLGVAATFTHAASSDVTLSTFGSDRPVGSGSACLVPATTSTASILFRTTAAGTLMDGDYASDPIAVESDGVGSTTRVGANTITQWQSPPFANATVTNPNAAVRGRDREDDASYNTRISNFIQSLSRATALAIETLTAGQQDPFTNLIISFAQTVEPVAPGQSLLYVTDGSTTFAIDYQVKPGRIILINDARTNDKRAHLPDYGPFQEVLAPTAQVTPRLYKSDPGASNVSTLTGANFIEDSTQGWTVNQWAGFTVKATDGQFYPVTSNTAIRLTVTAGGATPALGQYAVFDLRVSAAPLVPETDYVFNSSTGDLELVVPLAQHQSIIAADDNATAVGAYVYSRGLAAYAQRLVNGDRTDLQDYPGIKALGTSCLVTAPTVITPTIVIQIITASGLTDADLASTVQSVVQSYVNGLGIGQQVLISEIMRLVKNLNGVTDCRVISPTANVQVPDGQIARMNTTDVQVV